MIVRVLTTGLAISLLLFVFGYIVSQPINPQGNSVESRINAEFAFEFHSKHTGFSCAIMQYPEKSFCDFCNRRYFSNRQLKHFSEFATDSNAEVQRMRPIPCKKRITAFYINGLSIPSLIRFELYPLIIALLISTFVFIKKRKTSPRTQNV